MRNIIDKVYAFASDVALGYGVEVDDVELIGQGRRKLLRVIIDKEGGVSLNDCESFSKDLGAALDVEDTIQGAYTLEVSSPGLDRPLKRLKDFLKYKGRMAKVVLKEKVEGQNVIIGMIRDIEDDKIEISVDEKRFKISFQNISRAKLEIEI